MKKSRKYILGTLLSIYALIFIFVGVNRATESRDYAEENEIRRTPPAELNTLTDFNAISTQGDFILEIIQGDEYAVEYSPIDEFRGGLTAAVASNTLVLEGFGNRQEENTARVRITLPALNELTTDFNPQVSVSGFDQEAISLTVMRHRLVTLSDNSFDLLEIEARFLREIEMIDTRVQTEQLSINGQTVITRR